MAFPCDMTRGYNAKEITCECSGTPAPAVPPPSIPRDDNRPGYCKDYSGNPLDFGYNLRGDFSIYEVSGLQGNKIQIKSAMDAAQIPTKLQYLMMAMAMIETSDMSLNQRDGSKGGDAENFGVFNLNVHMKNVLLPNDPVTQETSLCLKVLTTAFARWGAISVS
jgi:hypothetical protein